MLGDCDLQHFRCGRYWRKFAQNRIRRDASRAKLGIGVGMMNVSEQPRAYAAVASPNRRRISCEFRSVFACEHSPTPNDDSTESFDRVSLFLFVEVQLSFSIGLRATQTRRTRSYFAVQNFGKQFLLS